MITNIKDKELTAEGLPQPDIIELLDTEAARINSPAFIDSDPVQFPRRFSNLQDIEIMAFISAMIAWGNRKMICRNAERIISIMNGEPSVYLKERAFENFDDDRNLHRTFFGRHLKYFLRGMYEIYRRYGSLDAMASALIIGEREAPAWSLVEEMQKILCDVNEGKTCSQCLPVNLKTSALKRINMALRWLVRDDGIVDMGVWSSIPKSKLFIPLDVHVGNVSRELGLLTRRSNDRNAVEELTSLLRRLRPDDPAYYDYALFGIGINSKS